MGEDDVCRWHKESVIFWFQRGEEGVLDSEKSEGIAKLRKGKGERTGRNGVPGGH